MKHYIDKDALVRELERRRDLHYKYYMKNGAGSIAECKYDEDKEILSFIDALEVKTDEENSLERFKSLQHISGDLHQTLEDWGYAPNLYFFDGMWHISWISCGEGDSIKDFEGNTPEEVIDKAYNWFHSTFCNE